MNRLIKIACAIILLLTIVFVYTSSLCDTGSDVCLQDFLSNAAPDGKPQILYTGVTKTSLTMRSKPDKESAGLGTLNEKSKIQIFGFDQTWLFCWSDNVGIFYLGRHNVDYIEPVSNTVPSYGVIPNRFIAFTSTSAVLRAEPDQNADEIAIYPANTRLSIWMINDGWAVIPYRRLVGYMWLGDLKELQPISPTIEYADEGDILSAFTSFYSTKETELNIGRMENIRVGCEYISRVYQPGEEFNFNQIAGPYREARGYKPSPVLIDGDTVAGYGGGTCQVSTTLYNALLQIPQGITIIYRRPHGPSGASYAPHGVDAAVGATNLNLIFRNDYDFPIRIDCTASNGALCVCIRKG